MMSKQVAKNKENKNYKIMKGFTSITIKDICDKYKLNRSSIMQGYGTDEQYILIKDEIVKRIATLFVD